MGREMEREMEREMRVFREKRWRDEAAYESL